MQPRTNDHALRVTRTLALLGSLAVFSVAGLTGCGASVSATDGGEDRVQPPDSQTLACVCCPSGDLSGRCAMIGSGGAGDRAPMPEDAGSGFIAPVDSGAGVPFIPDSGAVDPRPDASGEAPSPDAGGIAPPPPIDSGTTMDASVTYLDPPAGQRWCTVMDLFPARPNGPSCPVPGPLPPPEMDR